MAERLSQKLVVYTTWRANDSYLTALALGSLVEQLGLR
jgi:hypothetical protein